MTDWVSEHSGVQSNVQFICAEKKKRKKKKKKLYVSTRHFFLLPFLLVSQISCVSLIFWPNIFDFYFYWFLIRFLKVVSTTFLLVCFSSLKEDNCETCKNLFFSLQKLFLLSRKINFRILDIQISWRHQLLKHKTRNTFYWITWEVNTVC